MPYSFEMVLIARFPVLFSNILLLASAGTLIKVVYLVRENKSCMTGCSEDAIECSTLDGILHFVKFETKYLNEWIEFLHSERIFFGRSISLPFSFHHYFFNLLLPDDWIQIKTSFPLPLSVSCIYVIECLLAKCIV